MSKLFDIGFRICPYPSFHAIPKVRLLGSIIIHSYDYFSPGVTFIQIPEGLTGLAQRVRSVDDRRDLAGLEELPEDGDRFFLGGRRHARTSQLLHEA